VEVNADNDSIGGSSESIHAMMWDISHSVLRNEFRVNSADLGSTTSTTKWAGYQTYGQVALDADGDMVVSYSGFAPDVSQNVSLDSAAVNTLYGLSIRPRTTTC